MRANFNWKLTLFVVVFLPLTVRLGVWQLDRADEKREMLANHANLVKQPPIAWQQLLPEHIENYRNVRVAGVLNDAQFLLDNQMHKGKAGYELIQLLVLDNGEELFVSRGWLEGNPDRSILPDITTPKEKLVLTGYLYQPQRPVTLSDELMTDGWPKVVQEAVVEKLYKALGKDDKIPPPFILRLDNTTAITYIQHWYLVSVQPEKHIGYALQWFGMALLLLVLFVYASFKPDEPSKNGNN